MTRQTLSDALPAIVVAMLLILTAWGNAIALLTASMLGLLVVVILLRRELAQGGFLAATVGCAMAGVVALCTFFWAH